MLMHCSCSVYWIMLRYLKICNMFSVQNHTHKHSQTVYIVAAHLQLVWYDVHTHVHAHTLNLYRSKSEDKLLNPAASKLSTCAGTTRAGVTVFQKSAGHWHPHIVLQETSCSSLRDWRMMPWKHAVLFALSLSPERTGSSLVTSPFVMEMGLIQ